MKHWSQKQGEKTKWGYTWLCGGRRQHTQRGGGRGSNSNGINSSSVGTRNRRMQGRRYVSACYLSRLSVHFLSIQLAIFSLSLPMIRWSLSNFCFPIYNVAAFSFFFYSACDVVVVEQPRRKLIVVGNKSSSPETFVSFSFFFSLSLFWRNSSQTQVLSLSVHNERSGAECGLCTHRAVYIGLVTTRPRFPGSLSGWRVVVGRRSIDCVFLSSLYCLCVRCVCVIWPSEPKRGEREEEEKHERPSLFERELGAAVFRGAVSLRNIHVLPLSPPEPQICIFHYAVFLLVRFLLHSTRSRSSFREPIPPCDIPISVLYKEILLFHWRKKEKGK